MPGVLTPFDSDRARQAGLKSGEVRRAKRAGRIDSDTISARRLDELASTFERDRLGDHAAACAAWILGEIVAGRLRVRGDDAPALLRVCVDIARLEAGEHTSASLIARVDAGDALAHVLALRDRARDALASGTSATALAADDAPGAGLPAPALPWARAWGAIPPTRP